MYYLFTENELAKIKNLSLIILQTLTRVLRNNKTLNHILETVKPQKRKNTC